MLIGLIFGVIVVKTKSLMLAIGAHLMYNVAEQMIFEDNLHKFTRIIYFQNSNYLVSNTMGSLFYIEFIELIMLSIITISLVFLFRKDIFCKNHISDTSC